jgi:rubrerythrin
VIKKVILRIILEEAIAFEEKAYQFYRSALSRAVMGDSGRVLKKLLVAELKHRMKLDELQRTGDLGTIQHSDDLKQDEPAEISVPWPQINPWSTRNEILEAALHKEMQAYRYYKNLSERASLKAARDTFYLLADEENRHIEWIQKEMETQVQ